MDDVRVPRGAARRPRERDEQRGHEQAEPGPPAEVADHAVAVGDPEVPERERRDDLDLDALRTEVLDGVGDEPPDDVLRRARVGRREHDDLHGRQATVRTRKRMAKKLVTNSRRHEGRRRPDQRQRHPAQEASGRTPGTRRTRNYFPADRRHVRRLRRADPGLHPPGTHPGGAHAPGGRPRRHPRLLLRPRAAHVPERGRAARDAAPHPGGPEQHVRPPRFRRLVRDRFRDRPRLPLRPARVGRDPGVGRRRGARDLRPRRSPTRARSSSRSAWPRSGRTARRAACSGAASRRRSSTPTATCSG